MARVTLSGCSALAGDVCMTSLVLRANEQITCAAVPDDRCAAPMIRHYAQCADTCVLWVLCCAAYLQAF
jgi:hypothetical protein